MAKWSLFREDAIVLAVFYLGIGLALWGGWLWHTQATEFGRRCEAAGGVAIKASREQVCLRRDQVVRLP